MNATSENPNTRAVHKEVEISVIIPVYNRREYVVRAVKSALNQTFSREKYEIIVVKNFNDELIDNFLTENGIISLYCNALGKSDRVREGFDASTGKIISFLDDDDIFYESKLEEVHKFFANYSDLKLFIHDCDIYYEKEEKYGKIGGNNRRYYERYDLLHHTGERIIEGTPSEKQAEALQNGASLITLGNACFSRDIISGIQDLLTGGQLAVDVLPYYYSFMGDGKIIISSKKLMRYTVHESAVHPARNMPLREYIAYKGNLARIDMEQRILHYKLVEGTLFESLERRALLISYLSLLIFGRTSSSVSEVTRIISKKYPDTVSVMLIRKLLFFLSKHKLRALSYILITALYVRYRVR